MTMEAEAMGIRAPVACDLVGITPSMLDYWWRTDLVRPSVRDAGGSGSIRLYSGDDLVLLSVVKRLRDAGVDLRTCRDAVAAVRAVPVPWPGDECWLVLGEQVEVTGDIRATRRRQPGLFGVLDLMAVVGDIEETLGYWKRRQLAEASAD